MFNKKEYDKQWIKNNPEKIVLIRHRTYIKNRSQRLKDSHNVYVKNSQRISKQNHERYLKKRKQIIIKNSIYQINYRKTKKGRLNACNGVKKYQKTIKGRLIHKKINNRRYRNLGFNLIYPNIIDEKMVYHHINNNDVVCIPEDLHFLYYSNKTEIHRELLKPIIKQLYNI